MRRAGRSVAAHACPCATIPIIAVSQIMIYGGDRLAVRHAREAEARAIPQIARG